MTDKKTQFHYTSVNVEGDSIVHGFHDGDGMYQAIHLDEVSEHEDGTLIGVCFGAPEADHELIGLQITLKPMSK